MTSVSYYLHLANCISCLMQIEGWTLSEYSSWLDANTDENEVLNLIEASLNSVNEQKMHHSTDGRNLLYNVIRELLTNARASINYSKS